jgi:hypothetical protein
MFSKLRSYVVLRKFDVKLFLFSEDFAKLRVNKDKLSIYDIWNLTIFPNYAKVKRNAPKPAAFFLSKFTVLNYNSYTSDSLYSASADHFPYVWLSGVWNYMYLNLLWSHHTFKRSIGDGAIYLRGLAILFFFDATLTDDEPLWEPVEWSLLQTWIMFIFAFAWIAENLISSRYGSYTGRDKRVWFAWYKTFWLIEGWYVLTLGAAALFVIVPFYHEISYAMPLVVSWWNWYSRVFLFKFISLYSLVLYIAYYLQLNLGLFHWRKSLLLILIINVFLSYLLYTHFLMSFFAYFTDPNWYHKTRLVDYIQLSHEPNKWSWGNAKRDHFSYHKSTTVFWFKNDGPFASAFLLFHIMFFICLFALYIYWLTLFRRVYATQEITYTYTTYCVSALRQFFYYFLLLYLLIFFSFIVNYWRLPIEYVWVASTPSIFTTFIVDASDYHLFLFGIFL